MILKHQQPPLCLAIYHPGRLQSRTGNCSPEENATINGGNLKVHISPSTLFQVCSPSL